MFWSTSRKYSFTENFNYHEHSKNEIVDKKFQNWTTLHHDSSVFIVRLSFLWKDNDCWIISLNCVQLLFFPGVQRGRERVCWGTRWKWQVCNRWVRSHETVQSLPGARGCQGRVHCPLWLPGSTSELTENYFETYSFPLKPPSIWNLGFKKRL